MSLRASQQGEHRRKESPSRLATLQSIDESPRIRFVKLPSCRHGNGTIDVVCVCSQNCPHLNLAPVHCLANGAMREGLVVSAVSQLGNCSDYLAQVYSSRFIMRWRAGTISLPAGAPCNFALGESPQPGWKTFVDSPLYLSGAAPSDGPPNRLGILRGEDGKRTKTTWTQKYSLGGQYPEGKWLRCDYGAMGEVSLAMRLPDELKECMVVGEKGTHAGENEFEIACK